MARYSSEQGSPAPALPHAGVSDSAAHSKYSRLTPPHSSFANDCLQNARLSSAEEGAHRSPSTAHSSSSDASPQPTRDMHAAHANANARRVLEIVVAMHAVMSSTFHEYGDKSVPGGAPCERIAVFSSDELQSTHFERASSSASQTSWSSSPSFVHASIAPMRSSRQEKYSSTSSSQRT